MPFLNIVVNDPPSSDPFDIEGVVTVKHMLEKLGKFGPQTAVFKMLDETPRPYEFVNEIATFIDTFRNVGASKRLKRGDYISDIFPPDSIDRRYVHILILHESANGMSHFLSLRLQLSH